MPELPEVETVVRSLRPHITGRAIEFVATSGLKLRKSIDLSKLKRLCKNTHIKSITRQGKYILITLDSAAILLIHLGMTGRLVMAQASQERPKHTHVVFGLSDGKELRFIDARRFGLVGGYRKDEALKVEELQGLGVDPLSRAFTAAKLAQELAGSRRVVKDFLLDQRHVAGLGNIYVCEALFHAGISPQRTAGDLKKDEIIRLHTAVVEILRQAVARRGTTLRDYVDGDGRPGEQQSHLSVYGRTGKPCIVCQEKIHRLVQGARSTFFCPTCQR